MILFKCSCISWVVTQIMILTRAVIFLFSDVLWCFLLSILMYSSCVQHSLCVCVADLWPFWKASPCSFLRVHDNCTILWERAKTLRVNKTQIYKSVIIPEGKRAWLPGESPAAHIPVWVKHMRAHKAVSYNDRIRLLQCPCVISVTHYEFNKTSSFDTS